MNKTEKINTFLNSGNFAITGVSRDEKKFGRIVYKSFLDKGKDVFPINPNIDQIENVKVYKSVDELPSNVEALVIINNHNKTQALIDQAVAKGIKNIWIQQKSEPKGFSSKGYGSEYNIVTNECIMMWLEPVQGFHKFHRFFKTLFSKN